MKIICPECQAAYEIDVPESPSKDVSAKCAVCNSKFLIKKRSLAKSSLVQDSMTGPPLAHIDSESVPESTDDLLSGLEMDQEDFGELHLDHKESSLEEDKNLDDYLDQLLEEGFGDADTQILDESVQPPAENSTPPVSDMPSEEDLDRLFDSLIEKEIKSPDIEGDATDSDLSSENDPEEKDLDALLDEIILNNLNEEEPVKPQDGFDETESSLQDSEPLTKEHEEFDGSVADSMEPVDQEIESPEPENLSPENHAVENPDLEDLLDEDALEETPPEEQTSSAEDQPEDSEETFEGPQETAEAEPSADQPEEEKSDEDQWAEAFADQKAVQESTEDSDAEKKSAEPTESADQNEEKVAEETAEAEPSTDQQEEEKSDEDLWAEAFADQEAVQETAEDGDAEKKSEEPTETVGQNEKEGAEETAEAEAIMDSDEETGSADDVADSDEEMSSEDEEAEEEPERNEFGLSEADYEDDDDEVGDQYDEYGEDEEESSSSEKKKFAFITLPSTKMGKLVLGGGVLAVLLTGGGAFFALQTLAPPELTQMTKNTSEVPEGLKPKNPQENLAFQDQSANTPAEKPNPALAAALGAEPAPSLGKDTGNPKIPAQVESGSGARKGLMAALAPSNHAVQLGTIMPVAYNINDIRVLSFSLEAEMSDAESAQVIREAMPVFEKITITTVEQLMDKKFFNDILYVKEKLKKNLQINFNKTLEGGGRVKKITFKDFTVQ